MSEAFHNLTEFFSRDVCQRGAAPLKTGVQIAISVGGEGPFSLVKEKTTLVVNEQPPAKPDMTFEIAPQGLAQLKALDTDDLGLVGVEIAKRLLSDDPKTKMKARVHIGPFEILRNGYLGVLPLGGATLFQFLREKGFSGIGRIKKAMQNLRTR